MTTTDKLAEALRLVRSIVSEGAAVGFNCNDGDWADRLFSSQRATSSALAAYEAEAKPAPAEPTIEMLKAGAAEWLKYGEREACYPLAQGFDKLTPEDAIRRSRLTHVYRAMRAAAPAAPAEPAEPDPSQVICPNCAHQFRAIPCDVQRLMLDAGFEPPFTAPAAPAPVPLTDGQINELLPSAYVGDVYLGYSRADLCKLARDIERAHGIGKGGAA